MTFSISDCPYCRIEVLEEEKKLRIGDVDHIHQLNGEVKRLKNMIMQMDAHYTAGGCIPYSLKLEVNKIFKEENDGC